MLQLNQPVYGFLFRKMSMLTCSGVRRDRSLVTVSPAAENTRSEGTDVAVMHKYLTWQGGGTTFHNRLEW